MAFSLNQCFGCVRVWSEALVKPLSSLRPYEMVELNWRSVVRIRNGGCAELWSFGTMPNVDLSAVVLAMSISLYRCFKMEEKLFWKSSSFHRKPMEKPRSNEETDPFIKTQTHLLMERLPTKRFQKTYCICIQSIRLHKRTTVFEQRINPKWCLCVWMELPLFLAMASCIGGQPSPDRRQRKEGDIQGHI